MKLAIAIAAVLAVLAVGLVTVALPAAASARGGPVHAVTGLYNPCAAGHAPVDPDVGHCQGTRYIPS